MKFQHRTYRYIGDTDIDPSKIDPFMLCGDDYSTHAAYYIILYNAVATLELEQEAEI
jgi:hypothetical protein